MKYHKKKSTTRSKKSFLFEIIAFFLLNMSSNDLFTRARKLFAKTLANVDVDAKSLIAFSSIKSTRNSFVKSFVVVKSSIKSLVNRKSFANVSKTFNINTQSTRKSSLKPLVVAQPSRRSFVSSSSNSFDFFDEFDQSKIDSFASIATSRGSNSTRNVTFDSSSSSFDSSSDFNQSTIDSFALISTFKDSSSTRNAHFDSFDLWSSKKKKSRNSSLYRVVIATSIARIIATNATSSTQKTRRKRKNANDSNEKLTNQTSSIDSKTNFAFNCVTYRVMRFKKFVKLIQERSQNVNYIDAQRLQTLTLYLYEVFDIDVVKKIDIKHLITMKRLLKKILKHNYDTNVSTIMKLKYVKDLTRSRKSIRCDSIEKTIIIVTNKSRLSSIRSQFAHIYNAN